MGKLLMGLMSIFLVIGLIGAGSLAYFFDTETSTGNTLTAGTLNLQVGANDPTTEAISLSDLKPADTGTAANWLIKNTGSLAGDFSITLSAITNYENVLTEPEQEAGDITAGATQGELGANLAISIWLDLNENGQADDGEIGLKADGTTYLIFQGTLFAYYLNQYDSQSYPNLLTMAADDGLAGGNDEFRFRVEYLFSALPWVNDNVTQSDSSVFNITFSLDQS